MKNCVKWGPNLDNFSTIVILHCSPMGPLYPALKISWGPPTANLWPDWSPQKRVNRDELDQRQKMRKSRFNHQFCTKTCFNHQYCTKINYFFIIQWFIYGFVAYTYTKGQLACLTSPWTWLATLGGSSLLSPQLSIQHSFWYYYFF